MTFYVSTVLLNHLFRVLGRIALYKKVFGYLEVLHTKAKTLLGWSPSESTCVGLKKAGGKYKNERN